MAASARDRYAAHRHWRGGVTMLDWIAETLLAALDYISALMLPEDSPAFPLFRAMLVLLMLSVTLYVVMIVAPLRTTLSRHFRRKPF
jgi:hypothetical protein